MYKVFNKDFFGNKLPKDMIVFFKNAGDCLGFTQIIRGRPLYIVLDRSIRTSNRTVAMTLLHEMVHVKHPDIGHGKTFHREMLRLAKAGAFKSWW
jgi:hypothetical protein